MNLDVDPVEQEEIFSLIRDMKVQDCAKLVLEARKRNNVSEQDVEDLYKEGQKLYHSYKIKEASIVFQAYSRLNPFDFRGLEALSAINIQLKEYDEAIKYLELILLLPGSDLDRSFLNIGYCYAMKNMPEACVEHIGAIIDISKLDAFGEERYLSLKEYCIENGVDIWN